jgi:hypothetical protein
MLDYFKAELLRYRAWAIAYFLLHLAVLGFLTRILDLAQQPRVVYQVFAAVYALSGLLLGAFQMGSYRQPNAWLQLLHRPVPPRLIAAGLLLAGAALLLCAVLLPLLATAAWQDAMTARPLDARHLWLALSAWLVCTCGYLAGAFALLANRRYALTGFIVLIGLCFSEASGLAAIAVQLLALAWLVAMVLVAFQPDALAPPRRALGLAVVAAPLHLSLWFALLLLAFGAELVWIMQGTHPNNLPVEVEGSAKQADNAEARALMIAGLKASHAPQAAVWADQAMASEVSSTGPGLPDLPARGELMNPAPMEFDDSERGLRWVFSHDDMRFHGYRLSDQRAAGTLGVDGQRAFAQPPLPVGEGLLATRAAFYQFDAERNRIVQRGQLPVGETLLGLDRAGERLALLSQRALYLYDRRELDDSARLLVPRLRVPLPGKAGNLTRVELMELLDGVLVSFSFTRGRHNGQGVAHQVLLHIDEQGRAKPVAERMLSSGYGPVYVYNSWYTSPLLYAVQRRATALFAGYRAQRDVDAPPVPAAAWTLAAMLAFASALLAILRSRKVELTRRARALWVLAAALLGPPSLLALWLLYPRRESLDRPNDTAAPASA